jgi:hypothetical protein
MGISNASDCNVSVAIVLYFMIASRTVPDTDAATACQLAWLPLCYNHYFGTGSSLGQSQLQLLSFSLYIHLLQPVGQSQSQLQLQSVKSYLQLLLPGGSHSWSCSLSNRTSGCYTHCILLQAPHWHSPSHNCNNYLNSSSHSLSTLTSSCCSRGKRRIGPKLRDWLPRYDLSNFSCCRWQVG